MDHQGMQGVAVIGIAGRFPGAPTIDEFWRNLRGGVESITHFAPDQVALRSALQPGEQRVYARGLLDGADLFDASFFGYTPREAELMDPQHRIFLEVAWEALDHAGYDAGQMKIPIGVFAGLSMNTYLLYNLCSSREFIEELLDNHQISTHPALLGNDKDFLATRVSYKLGLTGPSVTVQTACSTSLVALTLAWQSLMSYQCDMTLTGGISISFPQNRSYLYSEGAMVCSDGHCRAFDADAEGMLYGAGAGVVVLKRLEDAIRDRDSVYAVILGAAINNDGAAKVSYMAPSVDGQAAAIMTAQELAGVDPETITYVEAHGTGTPLGDPIEIAALTQAFRASTQEKQFCAIGSVKTNIGHLEAAAGIAGLIKTVLALHHKEIPPSLNFRSPNPKIDILSSPFFVNTILRPWETKNGLRRAGVSAFGVGGTNAHVVLEEAPSPMSGGPSRPQHLLVLSAKTHSALQMMTANLAVYLEGHPEGNLADIAFTLQKGRKAFAYRLATVASNTSEAGARLQPLEANSAQRGKAMAREPSIVFLFPGQGTQYLDMGRELYYGESVFREAVDRCAEILRRHLDLDLREVLYPGAQGRAAAEMDINETWLAQPAIFMVEYALALLWMSWGVNPAILIGHSVGEYVAAVISEAFTLEDALALLAARARLMHALPGGAMLSVRLGAEDLEALLPAGVSLAAINSPVLCAVSGPTELLKGFQKELDAKDIATRFLHTSHAFHSAMMDPMLPEFAVIAGRMPGGQPKLPWVSTSTGRWMSREDLVDGAYWVRQIRHPVRFAEGLDPVVEDPQNILLEVGPGQTLSQLARQHAKKPAEMMVIATLGPVAEPDLDLHSMLTALGRLWVAGVSVDWDKLYAHEERRRLPLPTYPFERKRYWVEPPSAEAPVAQVSAQPASSLLSVTKEAKEPEMHISSASPALPTSSRKDRLVHELRDLFQSYSGADQSQADETESFLDLGFDSLLLTQASQGVLKRFGVKVTFRRMIGDLSTLSSLAAFLDEKLPPESLPPPIPAPVAVVPPGPSAEAAAVPATALNLLQVPSPPGGSLVEEVIRQQMTIMTQQLELLRQTGLTGGGLPAPAPSVAHPGRSSDQSVITAVKMEKESHFGPFKAIEKGVSGGLTERQQSALETLVARYNRRTAKSKALAQEHRACFCDPRAAGNFRQLWKEMVYPIVCARSKGSRIWDIDGNEYIDVTMGFGANYLGHSPDFVMLALDEQMKKGVEIGPQSPLAGEVAQMICEFTGMERATFCNTGSEAVMAAFRVARTVTGREKVVYFCGDYHGIFDEVLGRPALLNGVPGAMPIAPGIPHLDNVMILEYGSSSALDTIRTHAGEIAGVLVEPVQSRHPDLQPREFLQELRRLTTEHEIALIFDEVITGFRIAPGGAQEYFGVKADLATYGKVIGGGMPIGVLAGSSTYMDALDGGFWQYGDDSSPPTGVTFFAGTFVRHPLAMAAAHAVLKHLKSAGPALQERTNELTARFVNGLNDYLETRQLPMRLQKCSAVFYYDFHPDLKYAGLLFYYLRDRGIHIWEGRVGHISIAHTEQDLDRIRLAFQESVEAMQAGGFLPESGRAQALSAGASGAGAEPSDRTIKDGLLSSDSFRFPLAEAQREMWIGAQMRPEAAGPHHACTGLYLDGDLDVEMLRRAISAVVQRHEGLRCTFSEDGTEVILRPSRTPEIPVHDLSSLPEAEREARVDEILHQEGRRLLDMTEGPLVDFQILKLSPQRHLLIFTAQMIVCDGWSHYVVFEDLGELYTAFVGGREPSLKPVVPMREYARWEQASSGTDEARESETFWLSQFEAVPAAINLPTSHQRPPARTFEGARREVTLPLELYQNIKRLAKEQKNSYFAVLLAAFQVWLYRLSGARDLVVGVPFAAQGPLGMDSLVGQCASILPLRILLESDEAFSSVLKKAWSSVLDAQEHWDFTFGRLIPQLDLPRDPSRIPLVSVLFNIDPPMAKVKFSGLKHRFITGPRYYFQYDLGFNLVEDEDTIHVECDYNSNLFDGDVIQCWVAGYRALLEAVVGNPDQSLNCLPMMSERERGRLLAGEVRGIPADGTGAAIHALIEAQAARNPDGVAATCEGRSLTYRELDQRANRMKNCLQGLGIGPDTVVGMCAKRSLNMMVGLLAILKAGSAYVLFEPSCLQQQLAHVVADTGMQVILAEDDTASSLQDLPVRIVLLDQTVAMVAVETGPPPIISGDMHPLACVVYTSGANGKPRGIEITHRAVVNLLLSMQHRPGMVPNDVVLCIGPLSHGLEIFELWLPLTVGARTVLAPNATVLEPDALAGTIEAHGITVMQATPSAWNMLVASGWQGNRQLKALCSGEALPPDLADSLARTCKEVWNMHGSPETTVWSMGGRVLPGTPITLGRPVDNTRVVVTDEHFEPVPVGVPAEILISGPGLARGYRNLPSLTAESFVSRSIGGKDLGRFYRTGDSARWCPSGELELIGTRDLQVEVHGCQVDLGAIAALLREHAAVREVTVAFREDLGDELGLAAYIVPVKWEEAAHSSGHTEMVRELRRLVRRALPEYMHPARFVVVEALPREADGRVDRMALPTPPEEEFEVEDYVAPRNKTEEVLATIWQELLNLEKVSVKDSFFDLSGQSLLAVRLFNRIEQACKRRLPVAMLFRAPTIEQLAYELTSCDGTSSEWPSLVPIQRQGAKPPLFLVHGAGGNVLLYGALAKRLEPDYPLYGLQSRGLDGQSKPLQTIEEMAVHYLQEIRTVQSSGPYLLGGYCLGGTVAYEMAQRLIAQGESVALVAMFDTYNFTRALRSSFASFLLQKLRFHWGNFIRLRPVAMWRYLREKKRIAGDGGWAGIGTEMPGSTLEEGVARAESGIEASVQEINDHAGDIYHPRSYPGVLTLFKPHINYKFYPDPEMGWGDLALGGLDIVEMPINPHAMLVEPYVELLARELKTRLDRAVNSGSMLKA
jgi:amino acid adenylation domain-containing protein